MTDIVDPVTRSRMMAGIRGKDTKPEMIVRRELFKMGFRYRLHVGNMPGKPDLVMKKYRAAIFVHGCFWHGHDCSLFRMPTSNHEFWAAKISTNRRNDILHQQRLITSGWRVFTVWECSIRGKKADIGYVIEALSGWVLSDMTTGEISGRSVHTFCENNTFTSFL